MSTATYGVGKWIIFASELHVFIPQSSAHKLICCPCSLPRPETGCGG